jgi:hypothetical protein
MRSVARKVLFVHNRHAFRVFAKYRAEGYPAISVTKTSCGQRAYWPSGSEEFESFRITATILNVKSVSHFTASRALMKDNLSIFSKRCAAIDTPHAPLRTEPLSGFSR